MKLVKLDIYDDKEVRQQYVNAKHVMTVYSATDESHDDEVTCMKMIDGSTMLAKGSMKAVVLVIESGLG